MKDITLNAIDLGIRSVTQSGSILGDYVQNRLDVGRGAGDYAKNLAGSSLLLQGFANPT